MDGSHLSVTLPFKSCTMYPPPLLYACTNTHKRMCMYTQAFTKSVARSKTSTMIYNSTVYPHSYIHSAQISTLHMPTRPPSPIPTNTHAHSQANLHTERMHDSPDPASPSPPLVYSHRLVKSKSQKTNICCLLPSVHSCILQALSTCAPNAESWTMPHPAPSFKARTSGHKASACNYIYLFAAYKSASPVDAVIAGNPFSKSIAPCSHSRRLQSMKFNITAHCSINTHISLHRSIS